MNKVQNGWSGATTIPCVVTSENQKTTGVVGTPYGDLRFLNVSGSMTDMATDMAKRLREEVHLGVIPYFADYLEKILNNSPVKSVSGPLNFALYATIADTLKDNIPNEFKTAMESFAEVAGIDKALIYKAYLMPETFLYLLGTYHKILGSPRALGLGSPPMFGCTSAIAVPPKSSQTLHGRNFDYFGVDRWDRYATVTFFNPDDGMDYVSVATAGILGGGITAMNRAGLTFVVHQHFPDEFDLNGFPVGIAGEQVMRHAKSIDDAVAILRDHPPVGGWTYVMTEGDTGRAAVFEVAPGKESLTWIRSEENMLGYANVYWGETLRQTEVDYYPEYRRCNYARQERVQQCLADVGDREPTVLDIARMLGDSVDPENRQDRLLGPSILTVMTVASVVFEPAKRRVWVAAGKSPTCRGWYVPFNMGDAPGEGGPDLDAEPFLPYPGWQEEPAGRAFELYREASIGALDGVPNERLLILIEHAIALVPYDASLRVLGGLLALKLGKGRRAEGAFRRALERIVRPDRREEVRLFLAWALDIQGQRSAAKAIYRDIKGNRIADPIVKQRAKHGSWMRFRKDAARGLNIDFTYAGVP